ncbi:MAG: glycosyltransferase family 2 protein [Methylotenera sp.]|nr:glycosyltransferase family 2 protein [Methylotenera sp.]
MSAPVTVVIPNFNGTKLLRKNLPSVLKAAQQYVPPAYVIVVDDGSKDDSVQVLRTEFPEIKLVIHEQNKGFAEAVHSGIAAAETELIMLLNSDVNVEKDLLESLVHYFDNPDTFSVNPLIYDEAGVSKRHSWNLRQFKKGSLKLLDWSLGKAETIRQSGNQLPTLYGHGGSMMLRRSMFQSLGGFHPIYKPFYSEDYDLGIRAWRRGWSSFFEPNVSIVHQSIGSIREHVKMQYVKCIRRRNRYLLEWIHLTPSQLIFSAIPFSLLQLLGELLIFDKTNLKGFLLAITKIPEVMLARREINKTQTMSLNDVLNIINKKAN